MIQLHPYCAAWAPMDAGALEALANSIKNEGLMTPLVMYDGMVLDGQNRQLACAMVDVEPTFEEFEGDDDAAYEYVLKVNYHRRHDSAAARAMAVVRMDDARGLQRAKRGGIQKPSIGNVAESSRTVADRAIDADVSVRFQSDVETVMRADPVLADRVAKGEIAAHRAAAQVREGRKSQSAKPRKEAPAQTTEDRLRARIALLDARVLELELEAKGLRNDLVAARDVAEELALALEDFQAIKEGEGAKRFSIVRQQLKSVEATRDTLMGEGQQLLKEVTRWKKRAEKAEAQLPESSEKK